MRRNMKGQLLEEELHLFDDDADEEKGRAEDNGNLVLTSASQQRKHFNPQNMYSNFNVLNFLQEIYQGPEEKKKSNDENSAQVTFNTRDSYEQQQHKKKSINDPIN